MIVPWIKTAARHLGQHELAGASQNNEFIVSCLADVGLPHQPDETAWCAAFVHRALSEAGIKGTGRANARSYLSWGRVLPDPELGCVVIFARPPDPSQGHVCFFLADLGQVLVVLGGNQGNSVSVECRPRDKILGYRWPAP